MFQKQNLLEPAEVSDSMGDDENDFFD